MPEHEMADPGEQAPNHANPTATHAGGRATELPPQPDTSTTAATHPADPTTEPPPHATGRGSELPPRPSASATAATHPTGPTTEPPPHTSEHVGDRASEVPPRSTISATAATHPADPTAEPPPHTPRHTGGHTTELPPHPDIPATAATHPTGPTTESPPHTPRHTGGHATELPPHPDIPATAATHPTGPTTEPPPHTPAEAAGHLTGSPTSTDTAAGPAADPTAAAKRSAGTGPLALADPAVRLATAVRIVALGVAAIVQIGLCLAPLLRHPALAAVVAYVAFAVVTSASAFWLLRRRPLPGFIAATGTVLVLVASGVATAVVPADDFFRDRHWSFGLVGWLLLVLLSDRPPLLGGSLALHAAVSVAQFLLAGTPARTDVGDAAIVLFAVTAFQLAIGGLIRLVDRRTGEAAAVAAERERLETRAALARQAGRDLRAGFAEQLGATLPLLAGLADGTVDPRSDAARTRCALAAAQLRRLFAENDDVPDPLVHEVTACLDVAERRGVAVTLAVSGDPVDVPPALRRHLTGPVLTALTTARTRARVSVLRTPGLVRVAVVADTTGERHDFAGAADVVVTSHTQDGQTWMEARWLPA